MTGTCGIATIASGVRFVVYGKGERLTSETTEQDVTQKSAVDASIRCVGHAEIVTLARKLFMEITLASEAHSSAELGTAAKLLARKYV